MLVTLHRVKYVRMAGLIGYAVSLVSSFFQTSTANFHKQRLSSELEPFIPHKSLCKADFAGKNILIIGDVHGCYDEMMLILDQAKSLSDKKLVKIFVGDMINKGPKSEEVLSYLINEKDTYYVRGNHEQKILKEYLSFKNNADNIQESRIWVKNLSPTYINFIKNLPYTLSIPFLKIIIVHAGLVPGVHLTLQESNNMLNMRNLYYDDDMFHGKVLRATYRTDKGKPWADQWCGPEHIYFGHDAVRSLQIHDYSTGLDTGCVYGGKLTGVLLVLSNNFEIVSKQFLNVKPLQVYVPVTD